MNFKGHLFTILLSLVCSHSSLADLAQTCSSILAPTVQDPIHINLEDAAYRPTVEVTKTIDGNHGGKLHIVKKTWRGEWISDYATFAFDVQGDPRWFIGAMGEKAANFFGFEIIDSETITVPDAIEFQGALDKVNQVLISQGNEPVLLSLSTEDISQKPISGYLDALLGSKLPFATEGNHLIHDVSFHTGHIFTPPRLLKIAQTRTLFTLNFFKFIQKQEHPLLKHVMSILPYVKVQLVHGFDNGTAFANLGIIARKTTSKAVVRNVTDLVSLMNSSVDNSSQISIVSPSHLALGTYGGSYPHKKSKIVYENTPIVENAILLEDYVTDMIMQFIRGEFNYLARVDKMHPNEPGVLAHEVQQFIQAGMTAFTQTTGGQNARLNLLDALLESPEALIQEGEDRYQEILNATLSLTTPN